MLPVLLLATYVELQRAIAAAPGDKETWSEYGITLAANGEPARAEAMLAMALALDPHDAETWAYLGRVEKRLGRRERAEIFFDQSAALDPATSAHHDLGDLALARGDTARAEREYGADLDSEPTCKEARANLAALLLARGATGAATGQYAAALAFYPDDAAVRAGLSESLARSHRPRRGAWLAIGVIVLLAGALALVRKRRPA